jgi:hypothetical protein
MRTNNNKQLMGRNFDEEYDEYPVRDSDNKSFSRSYNGVDNGGGGGGGGNLVKQPQPQHLHLQLPPNSDRITGVVAGKIVDSPLEDENKAVTIQRVYRGYKGRKSYRAIENTKNNNKSVKNELHKLF